MGREARESAKRYAWPRVAERVEGVLGIVSEIKVLPGEEHSDADIAREAVNSLRWNALVPADRIKVKVQDGWITLKGQVRHDFERRAAEQAVRYLPGVKGVSILINVEPRVEPMDIKEQIERSFKRQAALDAERISVEVDGSKVILRGTVRSLAEKEEAEKTAWAAPGVTSVEDRITVRSAA
jgi:osmotically-inducible protein OsmY